MKTGEREGEGRNGHWKMASYLLETVEAYPKKMAVDVSGTIPGRIEQWDAMVGQNVEVDFEIDAHEYNGRWFNSLRAWGIRAAGGAQTSAVTGPAGQAAGTVNGGGPAGGPAGQAAGTVNGGGPAGQAAGTVNGAAGTASSGEAVDWDSMAQPAAKEPEHDNLPF